jgi:hypothetical protein
MKFFYRVLSSRLPFYAKEISLIIFPEYHFSMAVNAVITSRI